MYEKTSNPNVQNVLYGLCQYPWVNDIRLSEKIGIKQSTITNIKNRLHRSNAFRKYIIPNYIRFGYELMSFSFCGDSNLNPKDMKKSIESQSKIGKDESKGPFYPNPSPTHHLITIREPIHTFLVSIHNNFTSYNKFTYSLKGSSWYHKVIPFNGSIIHSFFEFSPLIAKTFDLKIPSPKAKKMIDEDIYRFKNQVERDILKGLVKHPELNSQALSKILKITRQTIVKNRKELRSKGLIEKRTIPELQLFGKDILLILEIQKPKGELLKAQSKMVKSIYNSITPFLWITSLDNDYEMIITAVKGIDEVQDVIIKLKNVYGPENRIKPIMMSIGKMDVFNEMNMIII